MISSLLFRVIGYAELKVRISPARFWAISYIIALIFPNQK